MKLTNFAYSHKAHTRLHDHLLYHINNQLSLSESIFRIGSDAHADFLQMVRESYEAGNLELSPDDTFIIEKLQSGKKALYFNKKATKDGRRQKPQEVILDIPAIDTDNISGSAYYVYRDSGKVDEETGATIAFLLGFGDRNSSVKNDDEGARQSFLARHKCDEKTDMNTPGWWSCNIHRWHKQLKLLSDKPW